ncbi:unnamed protein product [Schistosoma rodhaini]|uniref:Uncharacterized protein n=1 Tax=Schistosoma rodhaini TaxID=6188 RepID=A0AA85G8C0_9TREM|nr:unnamed protein product [Schistosoma rodhaini]CAH8611968.1 unnamed protein product [Schistosoma rodhaini]
MENIYPFSLSIILNLFNIQWIISYEQLYPTDFQSLNLGSCLLNGGDLYCQKYRRYSFCSIKHDECFCLPKYVSVYEMNDSWYTCKPLLTDLYCRIDSDCSYIHGSICHPGVGACVCPSGYEFVFQHFSCLPRANDSLNPFCTACQRINGVCVVNNRKNGLLLNNYYQNNLQCECPRKPNISDIKKYPFFDLCNPIPVDIGEECNHVNKVCISQNAICHKNSMDDLNQTQLTTKRNSNICVCHDGWIPVYQRNLDYFECFHEITDPSIIDCHNCYQSNHKCYQFNIGSINKLHNQYRCTCSLFKKNNQCLSSDTNCLYHIDINDDPNFNQFLMKRKNIQVNEPSTLNRNKNDCIEYLLHITCNQQIIHICFNNPYPKSIINYNKLNSDFIYLKKSINFPKFIKNLFNYSINNKKCYLINNYNHNQYCLILNIQFNKLKQCGIYEINYKYGTVFYGTLHAETTQSEISLLRNIHIDFACHINVSHLNGSNLSTSYFYDRSINLEKTTNSLILSQKLSEINNFHSTNDIEKVTLQKEKIQNIDSSLISLSIINLTKNISQNYEMILKISSTISEFILIEYCLINGQSIPSKIQPTYEYEKLLDLKCFNTNIHRIKRIIDLFRNLPEYQCILFKQIIHHRTSNNNNHSIWISQPFHLKNVSLYNSVYSTCLIRICQIEQFCTYAEFYSFNRTDKQYNDQSIQSKVYIPLIMLNNNNNDRNKTNLAHLFPPINFNNLIQFHFIQSKLKLNQTNMNIQLNDPIDVYSKHITINVNKSQEYVWIKYILGISMFTLICQIIIFIIKYLKKYYTKYKLTNHRNSFLMTENANEVQQSVNRDVNSKHIYHNGYNMENICQLHNTNIIIDNNRLKKERKDTECDIIEQNQPDHPHPHPHHQHQQQQLHLINSLPKSKQTNQSMECLFTYPLNKSNTILHYTNSYLKSPIYDQQDHNNVDQNDNNDHDLPHFTMDSCIKTKNNDLSQHISKSTLNIASSNQMKVPIEHSIINSCIHKNRLLPTCYHNDCLKQQYDYCTIYHNLKNHNYKNGWV